MATLAEQRAFIELLQQQMSDALVLHQTDIIRYANGQVRGTVGFLNAKVFPDLIAQIDRRLTTMAARGFTASSRSVKRLSQLFVKLDTILADGFGKSHSALAANLDAFSKVEAGLSTGILSKTVPGNFSFAGPSAGQLQGIVRSRPMQGKFLVDWYKDLTKTAQTNVKSAIQIGMTQGETVDQIVRRIRGTASARFADGVLQISRREAEMVVRTAVTHTASYTREAMYQANKDVIGKVRYVATLDGRTTIICASLDGKEFEIGRGPRPPQHRNCRSTTIPVLKPLSSFGLKNLPAKTQRAALGGPVSARQTFPSWLKRQPAATQIQVLGKTRYKLFKDGTPMDSFVNNKNQVLTLDQLQAKTFPGDASLALPPGRTVPPTVSKPKPATADTKDTPVQSDVAREIKAATTPEEVFLAMERAYPSNSFQRFGGLKNLGLEASKEAALALDEIAVSYGTRGFNRVLTRFSGVDLGRKVNANFRTGGGEMRVSAPRTLDMRRYRARSQMSFDDGWHASDKGLRGTIHHEFGHGISNKVASMKRVWTYIEKFPPTALDVSRYGITKASETFAEAVSAMMTMPRTTWTPWIRGFHKEFVAALKKSNLNVPKRLA